MHLIHLGISDTSIKDCVKKQKNAASFCMLSNVQKEMTQIIDGHE